MRLLAFFLVAFGQPPTALDKYVAAPDASYKWEVVQTIPHPKATAYVLEMTSQTWLTPSEVDRQTWKHFLTIIRPNEVKTETGFLFINGGNNNSSKLPNPDPGLVDAALITGSVIADLRMVPNQPMTFNGASAMTEDGLIAYTWDKFLRTGDEKWPMRLPMTKAAVRALDTVTAFCASEAGGKVKVDRFVVSGGSKRGWTAWSTAAVEAAAGKRVVAVVPFVIDLLNIVPSFEHHYRVYGAWSPAIKDYENAGIMNWTGTKQYQALMKIEEPFEYRQRLTLPKYIVNSAGDQFFVPDSSQFYWDDLKGPKYLRYIPNTDHSLRNSDAMQGMLAFYDSVIQSKAPPKYEWKFEKNGDIVVTAEGEPSSVKLWAANNPDKRDFRLAVIGPAYQATELTKDAKGKWIAPLPKALKGFTAYFVEVTWPSTVKYPFKFTTPVRVWPDVYPFPAFKPVPPGVK
jgi:PhoPQ-activated pathogenicity-related protein